jgi:hypothetical protein
MRSASVRPYVSIRQHTSAYVSIRQHTPAYARIRQHTPAYVRGAYFLQPLRQHTSAYVSIRQHTPAYASIRERRILPRALTSLYCTVCTFAFVYTCIESIHICVFFLLIFFFVNILYFILYFYCIYLRLCLRYSRIGSDVIYFLRI